MRNMTFTIVLMFISLLLSVFGHAVFLYQWMHDSFMVGIGDGIAQMVPFKQLLYDQYTEGEFFYSFDFGLGAGTYSELAYYFSTSLVFIVTVLVVFLLETVGAIGSPDALFWANAAVFISIVRLAFILFIATHLFLYMRFSRLLAVLGASFYGLTGMYFRHTVYWEFFADAFLWLPLLILGVEKIFREQRPGWFLAAVAISMVDNFYFSYVNFLLTGIYILFRLFIPLVPSETKRKKAVVQLFLSGLIGAGISAVSFVPAVYAYLNNHRPPFEQEVVWFEFIDNILFTSRYIMPPALFVLLLFCFFLYKNKTFRLFALLGMAGLVLHYSPMAASAFNGFSAPQYRWQYFMALVIGGVIAAGMQDLSKLTTKSLTLASALAFACYGLYAANDDYFKFFSLSTAWTLGTLLLTTGLLFGYVKTGRAGFRYSLIGFLFLWMIVSVNFYQVEKLLKDGDIAEVTEELLTGPEYDDPEIRNLIRTIEQREEDSFYRIDYMEGERNNSPIVQGYRGVSAYSSILNKNLLYFYLYDLEIDMARESVSRYATLGNRANLLSLIQGKYIILPQADPNVPYGFTEVMSSENYTVYENDNVLPFARSASTIYQEEQLAPFPPLIREHAMLTGIVLDGDQEADPLPDVPDQTASFVISEHAASFEDGILTVFGETGGLDLTPVDGNFTEGDVYLSFHLENMAAGQGFPLTVNGYHTTRKPNDSIYKTFVDDLTIRIPSAEVVEIRVPEGQYKLTELEIYEEPYDVLEEQSNQPSTLSSFRINGSRVEVLYNNPQGHQYLVMNIPYERGWRATVNGQNVDVLKANYAFLAVPLTEGENEMTLTYLPPFFTPSLIVSLLSLFLAIWWSFRKRRT
ncbi:YfhO family protein [Planococcus salinus]|uniref:YfhO family protein n=1 Tax=Planococcus salinus TaxID=1848460 RepID=A0A3M8P9A0_9BACL|nr:YfhO family protein [Planococcus salinus]RNF40276.1 hypothetical protein EEX84_06495 [Planococcus salinus]